MLRYATPEDRDEVLRWRNHPQVRRASLTTHVIEPAEHAAWWDAVALDPLRHVLVFEWRGRPSGVVMFDGRRSAERGVIWGFYLDVDGLTGRGELLPAWLELEREAVDFAFDTLGVDRLGGETLAWNTPVLQLHRRFGFTATRRYECVIDGEPQEVVWTELAAADRRGPRGTERSAAHAHHQDR
ncbi:GNAT family N-acetyltransferase [Catellatospora bangladeshensis]|uniref:UDP-4-amino-4,6-dideoxy-N-acetyl-beta-L-altrosami ne N-acetyltransferase n=1 Tax=Catellatospora bangladeshensis TaxID=310355 RepID=A0A8J3JCU3_9ACTN|nr:GNAT family N-acetyltransferase [Catellatospora bangladeshensis]GIF82517.1 UDP-4-amino-4,6-dideoxy-N-acetyl-beta-L-altrosami ne N-acetyltransferase [Catellatospora bangladeshensis]